MRSTIKQQNSILDEIKTEAGLKSRKEAYNFLYGRAAKSFKRMDYSLSHYMDGQLTITKDHLSYRYISVSDMFTPHMTVIED